MNKGPMGQEGGLFDEKTPKVENLMTLSL
jgi:hypothetical protein